MEIKRTLGERVFDVFNVCFMVFFSLITLYPVLYVVFAAFSTPSEFNTHTGLLFYPLKFTTLAITSVFENPNVGRGYLNTIFVVIVGTILNMFLTISGAYFLSRKSVPLGKPITLLIIFTMYFSGGIIPSYFVVRGMGMLNTYWALFVPNAISTFNLIIMRTAFFGVPESLEESARLDGAGHFTVLWRIMVPLTMPTVAVLILYYGVAHWNAWFNASIYLLRAREKFPLQLFLREIIISNDTREMVGAGADTLERALLGETIKYATIIVATVPILCLYPFLQRYFVKGIMVGAVKG